YEYDPFGRTIRMTGVFAQSNPFRFSTKRANDTTDLVLYEYRAYNPSTGRWLSRDSIGEDGGENLYGAFYNDPINEVDVLGLSTCKESDYRWIVHPPMKDRDLQSAQTITVNTTIKIGSESQTIPRPLSFSGLWGLTVTEPALIGGDCCCSQGGYKPSFDLIVHSQIYLLDKRSSAWGRDRIKSGDPSVDDYWYHSAEWYRRHLVMQHEQKHQAHGKKNYDAWKAALQAAGGKTYGSYSSCLQAVSQEVLNGWRTFIANESRDSDALHSGGRSQ
ncbi:MAG: RHS repeat-associated core domain-containing protein, partial [Verrucomicrobiota bacterium]